LSKLPENCPICGMKMERGYVTTGMQIWWSKEKTGSLARATDEVVAGSVWSGTCQEAYRCLNCKIVLIYAPQMQIEPPKQIEKLSLHEQLFNLYIPIHGGRTKQVLEKKIESIAKQGLNREEAIRKLAEKEGLIEKE